MSTRLKQTSMRFGMVMVGLLSFGALSVAIVAGEAQYGSPSRPAIVISQPSYPYDFSDDRVLVGAAEFVFLGEVVARVGNKGTPTSAPDIELPLTQFSVKVLEQIKGTLPTDEIIVSQSSGIDKSTGETVIFVANYEPEFGWNQIGAGPFGSTRAKDASDAQALVTRFQEAEQNQIAPILAPNVVSIADRQKQAHMREDHHKKHNNRYERSRSK